MLFYKSFDKFLIQKLNETVKNDISEKFVENEVNLDDDILYSMRKTLRTQILLFSQKQFNLMIKYLAFGKDKICKTHYLHKSNIDEFIKNIFILILRAKRLEDVEISLNFKNYFEIFKEFDSKGKKDNRKLEQEEEKEEDENEKEYEIIEENTSENINVDKYKKLLNEINEILINGIEINN